MKLHRMKINATHLSITDRRYFEYKDVLFKTVITSLLVYDKMYKKISNTTAIDDTGYNELFKRINSKYQNAPNVFDSINSIIKEVNISPYEDVYIDLSLYIESFIEKLHDNELINIYDIKLVDKSTIIITLTQINPGDIH